MIVIESVYKKGVDKVIKECIKNNSNLFMNDTEKELLISNFEHFYTLYWEKFVDMELDKVTYNKYYRHIFNKNYKEMKLFVDKLNKFRIINGEIYED